MLFWSNVSNVSKVYVTDISKCQYVKVSVCQSVNMSKCQYDKVLGGVVLNGVVSSDTMT